MLQQVWEVIENKVDLDDGFVDFDIPLWVSDDHLVFVENFPDLLEVMPDPSISPAKAKIGLRSSTLSLAWACGWASALA